MTRCNSTHVWLGEELHSTLPKTDIEGANPSHLDKCPTLRGADNVTPLIIVRWLINLDLRSMIAIKWKWCNTSPLNHKIELVRSLTAVQNVQFNWTPSCMAQFFCFLARVQVLNFFAHCSFPNQSLKVFRELLCKVAIFYLFFNF